MNDPSTSDVRAPRRTDPREPVAPGSSASDGSGAGTGAHLGKLHLVDPLEILAGLAAACVPTFCDGLRFDLAGDDGGSVNVSYPAAAQGVDGDDGHSGGDLDGRPAEDVESAEHHHRGGRISIAVHSDPTAGEAPIEGTITCTWHDPQRPTDADAVMARLLADQALAKIRMASLATALQEQRNRAANLELALATNREIGQAIGILMATDHLTATQAFERLRAASQHSHRKLRDIAADVTETGVLAVVAGPAPGAAPLHLEPQADSDRPAALSSLRSQRRTRSGQALVPEPVDS